LLAAKLFELGRVTLGQAAELAGLPIGDFSEALGRIGVSVINLTPDQLAHDLASA
jgi:predicted HTH domain antitoxin